MIKVCHMTSAHNTNDVRIFIKECSSLAKYGYDVYLVGKGKSREENGVHVIGFGNPAASRYKRMLFDTKKVYKLAVQIDADLYHFHDPELLPYAKKLKDKGKIVIFDSHENTAESIREKFYIPKIFRQLVYRVFYSYQAKICKKLDAVIVVTPNMVSYFDGINENVSMVTNYPIFKENIQMPTFREKNIGFAGGITAQWNHHNLISALEKTQGGGRYCLCGYVSLKSRYLDELKKLPGWKNVDFYGVIPHEEVAEKLSHCYMGITLLQPGFATGKVGTLGNNKIFEEMMAGLPIICTDFTLWEEIVNTYHCGICVTPDDQEQIAKAIDFLFDNPEIAKDMGKNGREAVRAVFSWESQEKILVDMYRFLMK